MTEDATVTVDSDEKLDQFDLSNLVASEESEPLVGVPDPSKSGREKKPPKDKPTAKRTAPPYREGKFVKPLTEMYGMVAMGIGAFDPQCGQAVMAAAENCATAWDRAAKENTAIRKALQTLIEGTTWSMLAAAHLPIVVAVVSHHAPEKIPPGFRVATENEKEDMERDQHAA